MTANERLAEMKKNGTLVEVIEDGECCYQYKGVTLYRRYIGRRGTLAWKIEGAGYFSGLTNAIDYLEDNGIV